MAPMRRYFAPANEGLVTDWHSAYHKEKTFLTFYDRLQYKLATVWTLHFAIVQPVPTRSLMTVITK